MPLSIVLRLHYPVSFSFGSLFLFCTENGFCSEIGLLVNTLLAVVLQKCVCVCVRVCLLLICTCLFACLSAFNYLCYGPLLPDSNK